jgi:hypothetical protein
MHSSPFWVWLFTKQCHFFYNGTLVENAIKLAVAKKKCLVGNFGTISHGTGWTSMKSVMQAIKNA